MAYFGPREKVYVTEDTEIVGMPRDWRRVLSMSAQCKVVGPFGCVYPDIEHALCAYRYLYTSNRPTYAHYFREEMFQMEPSSMCRRWGSTNGMSLLMTDPNVRVWHIIRDRCMFDLVFQRISRDAKYRYVLTKLIENQFTPVYHVRTAKPTTYWGATLNKDIASNAQVDRNPKQTEMDKLIQETEPLYFDPSHHLVGQNRLGHIMVEVFHAYTQFKTSQFWSCRLGQVINGPIPNLDLTPIQPTVRMQPINESETTPESNEEAEEDEEEEQLSREDGSVESTDEVDETIVLQASGETLKRSPKRRKGHCIRKRAFIRRRKEEEEADNLLKELREILEKPLEDSEGDLPPHSPASNASSIDETFYIFPPGENGHEYNFKLLDELIADDDAIYQNNEYRNEIVHNFYYPRETLSASHLEHSI
jgi:hypothetical protein